MIDIWNASIRCVTHHEANTQFSNYFQNNYIPHFIPCQQFMQFYQALKDDFGAMHTWKQAFLYTLSIAK